MSSTKPAFPQGFLHFYRIRGPSGCVTERNPAKSPIRNSNNSVIYYPSAFDMHAAISMVYILNPLIAKKDARVSQIDWLQTKTFALNCCSLRIKTEAGRVVLERQSRTRSSDQTEWFQ